MISVLGWIFSINARKQPCLHALPTSQYGRGRRRSCCLHCAPDLRLPVISLHPPGPQLHSSLYIQSFSPWNQFTLYALAWFWRTGELLFAPARSPQGKVLGDAGDHFISWTPHSHPSCSERNRYSESCPGRRLWKAKGAPRARRRRRAAAETAGGRGKVWPQLPLRRPGWFIPADRHWATAGSFMTSPSRWAEGSSWTPQVRDGAESIG